MAHLILLRCCNSQIDGENLEFGVHEQIEKNINQRKYKVNVKREGYNIPFSSQWKFMDYRLKKEIMPDFVRDLNCIILNPYPNNTKIKDLFFGDKMRSVGRLFLIIQYFFKWINRKKLISSLLFLLGILILSPFLILCGIIILINPLKPVPINMEKQPEPFCVSWSYNFVFGCLNDPIEKISGGEVQKDVL